MTVDLFDRSTIEDPYPLYNWLLREEPIYHDTNRDLWFVSPYKESEYLLKTQEQFSSAGVFFESTLIGADDPKHAEARKVIRSAFGSGGLELWREILGNLLDPVLDRISEKGECEFMEEVAWYLPMAAMATFLGVPMKRHADCQRWAKSITETASSSLTVEQRMKELEECARFFEEHVRNRHGRNSVPIFDLFDGSELCDDQMKDICMVLLVAGSETTTNQLGNSMLLALRNPEVFQRLRSSPQLVRHFIDESLRFDSPVQRVSRRTVVDVEILGQEIPKESYVIALLGAANRDSNRFKDPNVFDLDRRDGPHLAFGAGSHYCLGNQLSKVEAEIVWKNLLERFPDPEPSQPLESVRYRDSFELRGPASLALKFSAPGS